MSSFSWVNRGSYIEAAVGLWLHVFSASCSGLFSIEVVRVSVVEASAVLGGLFSGTAAFSATATLLFTTLTI